MDVFKDLSEAVSVIDRLKNKKHQANQLVSSLDREINDLYHVIEFVSLNAAELAKTTKILKSKLQQRREAKEQAIAISNFLSGNVESLKTQEIAEKAAKSRAEKYKEESLASYERLFGKKKKAA